jgi:nucleotide-binding universal stress UspA family protein
MACRSILVHCDATRGTAARLAVAGHLAQHLTAHLIGIHVHQPFQAPMFSDAVSAVDALNAAYAKKAHDEEARAKSAFERSMAGKDLSHEWHARKGIVENVLIGAGRFADLLILGQRDPEAPPTSVASDLVERVVMAGERPALVVPHVGAAKMPGVNVMICWNGSREAVRAATGALPLLEQAKRVHLLMVDPRKISAATNPAADFAGWLGRHGIDVDVHYDSTDGSDIGGVILSRAADNDVDLIVMGLYGHSRMRELVLGGASRTLLASMTVPVLVAH